MQSYNVVYGDTVAVYPFGRILKRAKPPEKLKHGMAFCHQSVFMRREGAAKVGFDLTYPIGADFNLLLGLYLSGLRFRQLNFAIAQSDATGMSNQRMVQSAREHYAIAKKHLVMTPWLTLCHQSFILWVKIVMFGYKIVPQRFTKK
jgi:hypothetical protein